MMRTRGFTLLEVMVSLSILALALTAIAGINAISFESSNYARHLTVATLLARSKMIDVEEELRKDGISGESDKEYDGDFSEEGFPKMKWEATCRKVEIDVGQLLGGLLGGEELDGASLPQEMQAFMGAMDGEGTDALVDSVEGSDLKKMMGGEMAEIMFKQVGEVLGNSIREITLEISWGKEGVDQEKVKFVQYVTTTGRLNFNNVVNPLNAAAGGLPGQTLPGQRGGTNAQGGKTGFTPTLPGGGQFNPFGSGASSRPGGK